MTIERLKALAQAYGADLRRWPPSQRPIADSLIATDPAARAALAEAAALDALLAASPTPSPSAQLTARVLAGAPAPRAARARRGRLAWFLGAGWTAAACAGVVAGLGLTTHVTAGARADAVLYQLTLSYVDDAEVLG